MTQLRQYLDWIASAEDVLVEEYTDKSLPDIEALLERILWRLTSSFLGGPINEVNEQPPVPTSVIQYFSFPLFSHFKEISGIEPYWINKYPIFFGRQSDWELSSVIARYAFLYQGLKSNEPHFSLTSFAGNMSWGLRHPPRYIIFDLEEKVHGRSPVSIRSDEHVFAVVCKMPAPPDISQYLLSLQNVAAHKLDNDQDFPVIGNEFSIERAENFWKSFEELADSSSGLREAIQAIEEYANIIENNFHKSIKSKLKLRENTAKNKDTTARGLARFIAWNYVLGFKKTIYCPFRIAEPFSAGESKLVSWGGGILVLSDTFPLRNILEDIISSPEITFPYAFDKPIENSLLELILGIRLFVDVATPKVIFGDWKYYQRTLESNTISKAHAEGITEGLEHEIRNLQSLVSIHIENPKKKEIVDVELEVSLQISKLVWMSYVDRDKPLPLSELVTRLREIVTWRTLVIKDNHDRLSDPDIAVPFPLLFVLAELCRNAYKYSSGNPEKLKREVNITFKIEDTARVRIDVTNKTDNTQTSPITCDSRVGKKNKTLGLAIVMKIVCDMLGGAFSFQIDDEGSAIASLSFPLPKIYEAYR